MTQHNSDILSAMSTIRAQNPGQKPRRLFVGLLMLVFLAILLVALVCGVTVYQRVAQIQMTTNEERLGQQLIANNVRAKDGEGTVRIGTGPEGRSLVLVENLASGSYETRIYLYEGEILEEYSISGLPYDPSKAVKLADSSKLLFSYEDGLVTIVTDQGTSQIALRSMQGAR